MKKAAAISLVLVTLTLCALFMLHMARREAGKTAAGAIELVRQVLNITPEVTITSFVARQQTKDVFELASVSKDFPVDFRYEHTQFGSTKRLTLVGQYTVKAGFDLRDRFTVQIDRASGRVRADFPPAKILSVEQQHYKILHDENGLWNRLSQKDQELAVNEMNQRARATALELQVCEEAKAALRRQLLELAKKSGQTWEIVFRDDPIVIGSRERVAE